MHHLATEIGGQVIVHRCVSKCMFTHIHFLALLTRAPMQGYRQQMSPKAPTPSGVRPQLEVPDPSLQLGMCREEVQEAGRHQRLQIPNNKKQSMCLHRVNATDISLLVTC